MTYIKFFRIFLLILIFLGIGLLVTQKMWVPKLVNKIYTSQEFKPIPEPIGVKKVTDLKPVLFI